MKGFLKEFKEFAMQGDVMSMAVGIIIGGAFTAIVTSLVDDIINPLLGVLVQVDFSDLVLSINDGAVTFRYGSFIMAVINFLIVALVLFLIIRSLNRVTELAKKTRAEEEAEEPTEKDCPYCQSKIPIKAVKCPHCTSDL